MAGVAAARLRRRPVLVGLREGKRKTESSTKNRIRIGEPLLFIFFFFAFTFRKTFGRRRCKPASVFTRRGHGDFENGKTTVKHGQPVREILAIGREECLKITWRGEGRTGRAAPCRSQADF